MAISENFTYDARFSDNILTGYGKTSFVKSLVKNKMFGDGLLSVDWVSKINLTKAREDEIKNALNTQKLNFIILTTLTNLT